MVFIKSIISNFSIEKYKDFSKEWMNANISFWKAESEKAKLYNRRDIKANHLFHQIHQDYCPVFVLSTGRCGTKLLTQILELAPEARAYHDNIPELTYYSGYAFSNYQSKIQELMMAIDVSRYEQIRNTCLLDQTYIETNNRVTFFCNQLAELYPKSKFIHLYRNAYKVVQSGYSRGWYENDRLVDEGRIISQDKEQWEKYDQVEKIAWAWNSTNQFIEDFKKTIQNGRILSIKAEDLFSRLEVAQDIFDFMDLQKPTVNKLKSIINTPVNKQKASKQKLLTEKDREKIAALVPLNDLYYSDKPLS